MFSRITSTAVRNFVGCLKNNRRGISTTAPRPGGFPFSYRALTPPDPKYELAAEVAGGFMWWWIFWHLFTDIGHIIGEHEFPNSRNWTDEELGVPPLKADDPE